MHGEECPMTTIPFTEFRRNASGLLSRVERGEVFLVVRHGRPIAEITPVAQVEGRIPAWKKPGVRLVSKGASLTAAIIRERANERVL
jgi:prevent-host-death family protein